MCDVRKDMAMNRRISFTEAFVSYSVSRMIDTIFDGCDQSVIRDVKRHMVDIDVTDKNMCKENIKRILTYIAYNGIPIKQCIVEVLYSIGKCMHSNHQHGVPCSEQKIAQFRTHYLTKESAYVSTQSSGQFNTFLLNHFSVYWNHVTWS
jgi:hypothetical protein